MYALGQEDIYIYRIMKDWDWLKDSAWEKLDCFIHEKKLN